VVDSSPAVERLLERVAFSYRVEYQVRVLVFIPGTTPSSISDLFKTSSPTMGAGGEHDGHHSQAYGMYSTVRSDEDA
jgi:hypothetical protein